MHLENGLALLEVLAFVAPMTATLKPCLLPHQALSIEKDPNLATLLLPYIQEICTSPAKVSLNCWLGVSTFHCRKEIQRKRSLRFSPTKLLWRQFNSKPG